MNEVGHHKLSVYILATAGLALVAGVIGLAFAGWLDHGAALFLALAEAGLSLCM
ncbi:hypothetical protein CSC94_07675 [Zhengella mangrovi]|uniref:Uncharacterized protein n=1 Tax=Zhengella mangrovi TaxID=1982044 RepID=A0A2G1QQ34_9HYPH|nr:hypothetical protein [Zhengella mangrovi]PHP67574.1 hypothetical protein CSC94_07675 [Zhengella mangrovi]